MAESEETIIEEVEPALRAAGATANQAHEQGYQAGLPKVASKVRTGLSGRTGQGWSKVWQRRRSSTSANSCPDGNWSANFKLPLMRLMSDSFA